MTVCSSDVCFYTETSRGVEIRTAASRKAMITELLENSGAEIALWGESEAKRIADLWRVELARCERCGGEGAIPHPDAGDTESEVACPACGGCGKK